MSAKEMLAKNPLAIVLSGGPSSVYAEGAPQVDAALFDANLPVFGICYGFQAMAATLGGTVAQTGLSEFGATELTVNAGSCLFEGLPQVQNVWMSHGDSVQEAPAGFTVTASSAGAAVAAFEDLSRGLAGVQFHPEVMHSEHGQKVLEHFLYDIAKIEPTDR
jgi:GMP synthase (glutamine-hydrolysing)